MKPENRPSLEADSGPFSHILRIFEERKEQLRFPDVDAEKLNSFQIAVQKEQEMVCAMEEKLAEAREALVLAEQELHLKMEKAHAYLQVFAVGNAELEAELAEIKLSGAERSGRKRRPAPKKKPIVKTSSSSSSSKSLQEEPPAEVAAE